MIMWQRRLRVAARVCIGAGALAATGVVAQAVWVMIATPRLPPPSDQPEGVAEVNGSADGRLATLALLGDSPVEGVGCASHEKTALSGCTAKALAMRLGCPVHWRAIGRGGFKTADVEATLLPELEGWCSSRRHCLDVLVLSCGVNDTLGCRSAAQFRADLDSLLGRLRGLVGEGCLILVLGLPDFDLLPFLPWPLSALLGQRGRALGSVMGAVVESHGATLVQFPSLTSVAREHGAAIADLLASDGFHPEGLGSELLGDLLAEAVEDTLE